MKILSFFDPDPEKLNYKPDWKVMSVRQKAAYIRDYYKIPIAVGLALLILVISLIVHYVKRTNTVLYVGSANLLLSEEDRSVLTDGYIAAASLGKRDRVSFSELGFISEDEESAYIGETEIIFMKLMAVCAADQLDVVLLDRYAFDVFSRSGYLLDLSALPKGTIPEELRELLVENAVEVDSITTGEFNEGSSEGSGEESSEESGGKASGETGEESGGKASGETGEESGVGSGEPGDGSEPETEMRTLGIDLSAGARGDQPEDAGKSRPDDTDENQSDDTDENRSDDAGENRSDGTLPQDSPHIYACILEQTSRLEESLDYIRYLRGINWGQKTF